MEGDAVDEVEELRERFPVGTEVEFRADNDRHRRPNSMAGAGFVLGHCTVADWQMHQLAARPDLPPVPWHPELGDAAIVVCHFPYWCNGVIHWANFPCDSSRIRKVIK